MVYSPSHAVSLAQIARVPDPADNAAIAIQRLEAALLIRGDGEPFYLSHTVLEGHRFAIRTIEPGEALLSWGLPFGRAVRTIRPGDYLCNERILSVLRQRRVGFPLPSLPNFAESRAPHVLDEAAFRPGSQVVRAAEPSVFSGFRRPGRRGVGTRNFIVVLATSSRAAGYARAMAEQFPGIAEGGLDGVTAVCHTEGGGLTWPNNAEFVLRCLAGFMAHPNVGAVLAVDLGSEVINNAVLEEYLRRNDYPLEDVPHAFISAKDSFAATVAAGAAIIKRWIAPLRGEGRARASLAELRVGLQCGGSDAFSGISANPLLGAVARELVRQGGSANLAETDELIGAEPYILANIRDLATARAFLEHLLRFQERVGWHGHTAEANPSGGNLFRGLYNIAIKSIGAARKKDPAVCVDWVIDYAQRMGAPGFYFMDSPGNDLESVAGQVGAGCNLIVFTTGNGSITNFPFVPTIKVMTNTGRFNLLAREMDFNAGRFLDGEPMEDLTAEAFAQLLAVAGGVRTAGERAGHAQVQIWRDWRQTDGAGGARRLVAAAPDGVPVLRAGVAPPEAWCGRRVTGWANPGGPAIDRVGLIIPTSLCSGQIARLITERLNHDFAGQGVTRFVTLVHTEGCGVSGGYSDDIYFRTMTGYLGHPLAGPVLLLEHGCEKTHNDAWREYLAQNAADATRLGWASVQLDGGLEKVTAKVTDWFTQQLKSGAPPTTEFALSQVVLALSAVGAPPDPVAAALGTFARDLVAAGGTIVVPENAELWRSPSFLSRAGLAAVPSPTLAYGQPAGVAGFQVMETPTDHWVETITGLGAAHAQLVFVYTPEPLLQGHPLVPVLQISSGPEMADADIVTAPEEAPESIVRRMAAILYDVAAHKYAPRLLALGNTDFQMTRGWLGVSM